ncbi:hypothetical protein BDEG_25113 [Batrachochytrium dendrobatidis JEL423]|uniref:WD repeat-containing protein JIP5 n=1 Tax=Batrachochytrium dendrobatidis (strain JEL423) TaxID=403673 RepID=A0A177WPC8_BATDL|nr:hypothetical protein BDEG_25113 [Batrachochytrium dendrobatidis JEL423]
MIDVDSEKVKLRKVDAHSEPINIVKSLSESMIATGDDAGCIKIWDTRQRRVVRKYHDNRDFITDFEFDKAKNTLLATGGDGCLSVYNLSSNKAVAVSASQDDELLSVKLIRNSTKAVVGTQSGVLLIFSFGNWGDCTDRFPGHPMSVSSLVKNTDSTIFSGSSDGIIRSVGMFPHRLIGAVADTGETMPIEKMRMSFDDEILATCSHDTLVKFWKANDSGDRSDDKQDESDDSSEDQDSDEDKDGESDESVVIQHPKSVDVADKRDQSESEDTQDSDNTQDSDSEDEQSDEISKPKSFSKKVDIPLKRQSKQSSTDDDDSSDSTNERRNRQKTPKLSKAAVQEMFQRTIQDRTKFFSAFD